MTDINLPPIEDLDVDDLASLPKEHRYELHEGNLVIMTPSTYWHKVMARRLMLMLYAAGLEVLQDTGIRGDRPRDSRLLGVPAGDRNRRGEFRERRVLREGAVVCRARHPGVLDRGPDARAVA